MTADLPLHPSQAWYLHEMSPRMLNPNKWTLSHVVRLPEGATIASARAAAEAAWRRHEALRATFHNEARTWRQRILDTSVPPPFRVVDLSGLEVTKHPLAMAVITEQAQGNLHIATGPLVQFVYVPAPAGTMPCLLVMTHHLVSDGLSTWLLARELAETVTRCLSGRQPPAAKSAPYGECVRALHEYARSPLLLDELAYWTAQPWDDVVEPPGGSPNHDGQVLRPWTSVTVVVAREAAAAISAAPARLGMSLEQVTLAAVADAVTVWAGGAICVRLLKHGRDLTRGVDGPALFPPRVQWTVGWFATGGAAILPPRGDLDPASYARCTAEWATAAPNHGIGLNLLHWLAPSGPHSVAVSRMWAKSTLLFNYLGSMDTPPPLDETFDAQSRLPMHVRVAVTADRLFIMLDYDPGAVRRAAITRLATLVEEMFSLYAKML